MPAIAGTVSSGLSANAVTSFTLAHTATGDPLFVSVGISDITDQCTSVTYGGVALERLGRVTGSGFSQEWWILLAPVAGTANIVCTLSGSNWISVGARNVSGADLDGVAKNLNSALGTSTAPSVVITSAVGDLVLDIVSNENNNQVFTPGAGQTSQWAQSSLAGSDHYTAGSSEAGAASVTMSWTQSISGAWLISGLSIPAAGTVSAPETRVTQTYPEVLIQAANAAPRVTQTVVEVLTTPLATGRVTQAVVEVLSSATPPTTSAGVGAWMGDGGGNVWVE